MAHGGAWDALIIGLGNEWRGDDGAGPDAARRIEALRLPNVRTLAVHQLTPELAEPLSAAERAFFVDACRAKQPAAVMIEPISTDGAGPALSHVFSPQALLALSRMVYGRVPRAWMVTIEGRQFEPGAPLSGIARRRTREAVQRIKALLI